MAIPKIPKPRIQFLNLINLSNMLVHRQNDIESMDNARKKAEQREQNVEPKMKAKAHLEKHANWWQKNCGNNSDDVHITDI